MKYAQSFPSDAGGERGILLETRARERGNFEVLNSQLFPPPGRYCVRLSRWEGDMERFFRGEADIELRYRHRLESGAN